MLSTILRHRRCSVRNIPLLFHGVNTVSKQTVGGNTAAPKFHSAYSSTKVVSANSEATHFSSSYKSTPEYQKDCWETYLSSGRGSKNLFNSIDTDSSQTIEAKELRDFFDAIKLKGVHPRALRILDQLAHDHNITFEEFQSWLILATKYGYNYKNKDFMDDYHKHPQTGHGRRADETDQGDQSLEPYHSWNETTMNQAVRRMQYAVRGKIVMKADEMATAGKDILWTNIGNPQAVGTKPISYYRQVLSLCDLPAEYGVDNPNISSVGYTPDVIDRAKEIRGMIGTSGTGAYTGSQGILGFRQDVANFIEERDGHSSYPANIFLTNGASTAIDLVLTTLISCPMDAVMIPIPQYPIYSAILMRLGAHKVGYYLDEEANWSASKKELEYRLQDALYQSYDVKALVIINPGNPTGQVFTREELEIICKFCADNGIVLLSDEVYQRNVYADDKEFISAKKVACETKGCENLELISFHSTSKGTIGECGRRGGYMELHNIDPYVHSQLYKLASSFLCSNVDGQIMTSLMVKPPMPGGDVITYERFVEEESAIFEGLKRRSKALVDGLNSIDGIECNAADGAMYAFPKLTNLPIMPLLEICEKTDATMDGMYAMSLLEDTGICVVPATGFGQKEGRHGFRTTFLPDDDKLMAAVDKFASHHKKFVDKYSK